MLTRHGAKCRDRPKHKVFEGIREGSIELSMREPGNISQKKIIGLIKVLKVSRVSLDKWDRRGHCKREETGYTKALMNSWQKVPSFLSQVFLLLSIHSSIHMPQWEIESQRRIGLRCSTGFPGSGIANRGKRDKCGVRITEFEVRHFMHINSNHRSTLQDFVLIL